MRIVLVNAPDNDIHAQRVNLLIQQAIKQLCQNHSGYECIVLPGKKPPGRFSFFEKRRQQQEIKHLNPDIVVYASLINLLAIKSVKTVVLVTQLQSISQDKLLKNQNFKQATIITDSMHLKNVITNVGKIQESRIHVIPLVEEHINASLPDNQLIREKYTLDKEYFFYAGSIGPNAEWEPVLQAFSQFKKWQQSGLQLVLAGAIQTGYQDDFKEKLGAYKYRQDVICLNNLTPAEKTQCIAAAFAMMSDAGTFEGRMNIISAFRTGVPVITNKAAIAEEFCGEAVLYADFKDPGDLSQKMIGLYKNEDAYIRLAETGKVSGSRFNHVQMLDQLHKSLQAVSNNEFS